MKIDTMTSAAAKLGVHYITLRRWCESGKLKCMRDSTGRRLFRAETIDRLVREREAARNGGGVRA